MKKILVTDLFGTIIPDDPEDCLYYYGDNSKKDPMNNIDEVMQDDFLNKVFEHSLINLKKFLSEGNDVYLVTSAEGHDDPFFVLKNFISRFYDYLKDYMEHVYIFLAGDYYYLENLKQCSLKIDDSHYICEDIEFYHIPKKENVFDFILGNNELYKEKLFTIGNSDADLPMLVRGLELGGQSSLIDNALWRIDAHLDLDFLVNRMGWEYIYHLDSEHSAENKSKIFERIYEELKNGSLRYEDLLIAYKIKLIIDSYNYSQMDCFSKRQIIDEKKMKSLTMYPTFNDYSNRVLNNK